MAHARGPDALHPLYPPTLYTPLMPHPFSNALPYPSRRQPLIARNIVATSHPLAAQAGLETLRRGGNAVDAAIATAMTLTVVEPSGNGIGSDNFALIWAGGGLHGLNASGRAPALMIPDRYAGLDAIPANGYDGVTVPGAPSGWIACHEQFGSLPLTTIAQPAIDYARHGHPLSPGVGSGYRGVLRRYREGVHQGFFDTFSQTSPDGQPGHIPGPGDTVFLKDHADSLQAIAETRAKAFYEGDIARRIDAHSRAFGGSLRAEDLAAHRPEWVRPMAIEYRGWKLHELPPNGQGIAALIALGILRRFDLASMGPDEPLRFHLQIEAMKLAFRDADRYVADPAHMDIDPASLIDDAYLDARAQLIDPARAQDFAHGKPPQGGTVLLTTADAAGNMVSFIQSNYTGFGSGVVVPGTGISLQNRGCCFKLDEGHPNRVAPGKRPYHTIIPAFVTRADDAGNDTPLMTFGVMGGFMQPQGHVQVFLRMRDHNQNPQAAIDAPRFQIQDGLNVDLEPGLEDALYTSLENLGHRVRRFPAPSASFGRGQAIFRLDDAYIAGSDSRADGQAVGY